MSRHKVEKTYKFLSKKETLAGQGSGSEFSAELPDLLLARIASRQSCGSTARVSSREYEVLFGRVAALQPEFRLGSTKSVSLRSSGLIDGF